MVGLASPQNVVTVPAVPRPTLRQWERLYVAIAMMSDVGAGLVAGLLAFVVAANRDPASTMAYLAESAVLPFALLASIAIAGGYERRFMGIGPEEFRRVFVGAVGLAAFAGFLSWATDAEVARSYVVIALPTAIALTGLGRYALRKWVHLQRRRGRFSNRTVVVGPPAAVQGLATHLGRVNHHGYEVVGACVPAQTTVADDLHDAELDLLDAPLLGTLDHLPEVVSRAQADTVAVVPGPGLEGQALRELAWALEPTGANIVVSPTLIEAAGPRLAVRPVDGLPLLHVDHPRFSGLRRVTKATYDPILAALILVAVSPFMAVIALAIKLDSRGPVFFRQERVGRLGQPFRVFKFRTMVADADRQKDEIAHLNDSTSALFKVRHDPRVTRVGSALRKASLDELPQLLNVVAGQMSLVGPRPHLPEEIALAGPHYSRRLFVKPGMTGLWQISGRSDLSLEESIRLDLRYVENWTLAMDVFILWKTVSVVLNKSGAY